MVENTIRRRDTAGYSVAFATSRAAGQVGLSYQTKTRKVEQIQKPQFLSYHV